jgi:lipopolysaccharide export system protein LptA
MRAFRKFLGLAAILSLVIASSLSDARETRVHLRRADLMRIESTPQGSVRHLEGNVWITQDTLSITSDYADQYEALGQLIFTGKVHFVEPTRQIWADQATYYENDGRAVAQGNVRIEQNLDSLNLSCNQAVYREQRKEVNMIGNVRIHSLKENAILTGGHGLYNRPEAHASMEVDPRLVRYFDQEDSMVVTGKLIEYYIDKKEAVVTRDAHVQRNDFDAWGDRLHYHSEGEWARLTGHPKLVRNQDVMTADTVDVFFQEKELKYVYLAGKAVATSPVDTLTGRPLNVMMGRQMDVSFAHSALDSIKVRGNAVSLYYVRQQEGESGANRVSGDAIDMKVEKGQVTWVHVEGATEGTYFPKRLEGLAESDQPTRSESEKNPPRSRP